MEVECESGSVSVCVVISLLMALMSLLFLFQYGHNNLITIPGSEQRRSDVEVFCSNCSKRKHFGFVSSLSSTPFQALANYLTLP